MLFYNILTIPKLQTADRGQYTCRVSSGEKTKQKNISVIVYGEFRNSLTRGYISQKYMEEPLILRRVLAFVHFQIIRLFA